MSQITIGRTLDNLGKPIQGTGITLDSNSVSAKLLLSQKNMVLFTNPITNELGAAVELKNTDGSISHKGFAIMPPNASGPPEHIHPAYEEYFEVVEGEVLFSLNGKKIIMQAGEKVIVQKNVKHTFKPTGKNSISVLVEAKPIGKLNEVVHNIFGLAHDGKLDKKGQPKFWQGIAFGNELQDDTLFTSPPIPVQKFMFKLLGNYAKKLGYSALYEEYMDDGFWKRRVEQI